MNSSSRPPHNVFPITAVVFFCLVLSVLLPMTYSFTTSHRLFVQVTRSTSRSSQQVLQRLIPQPSRTTSSSSLKRMMSTSSTETSTSSLSSSSTPSNTTQITRDQQFMKLAIRHAQNAYRDKEVPIGAVVISNDGTVLAASKNQVESLQDASAHAELQVLKRAANVIGNWRLTDCTLYTTLEPCSMCLSAIQQFRIPRVVYGARDIRLGACGSWINLHEFKHPFHKVEIVGGVLEEESSMLLKRFFQGLRSEKSRYASYDLGRGCVTPEFIQLIEEAERDSISNNV